MTTQEELFPKTPVEVAEVFLEHFQADVDSAQKSLVNAKVKLKEAQTLRDMAEGNLLKVREAAPEEFIKPEPADTEILGAMVVALYPTDEDGAGHPTPVGEHTLYGELVADYLTDAGLEDPIDDYKVLIAGVGEDPAEVQERDLGAVIAPPDYGKRLIITAAEQRSVTGVEVMP